MASGVELVVADDPVREVGERLAAAARAGGHIALTGGRTPRGAYEIAAGLEPDWARVEVWWGDERCVPLDDERSNYRLAKESLLDRVSLGLLHRIHGELGREQGAELLERDLASLDRFDLVLLGLGSDGHVASLFPNESSLDVTDRRAVGAEARLEPFVDRITLTLPPLCGARQVVFLVTGEDKADAAKRAFGTAPSRATPGSLVRGGTTTAVLDAAAAALL